MRHRGASSVQVVVTLAAAIGSFLAGYAWLDLGNVAALQSDLVHLTSRVNDLFVSNPQRGLPTLDTYSDVLPELEKRAYKPVEPLQITYDAISGMMSGVDDPYTRFMTPKAWKAMQEDTAGNYVGVGATLDPSPLGALIKRPLPDSPTSKAGIKAGDLIVAVDSKSVIGMDIDEIVHMIRGEEGKPVTLRIHRKLAGGGEKTLDYHLIRARVDFPTVEYHLIKSAPQIGYVFITEFNERAAGMLADAMDDLQKKKIRAIVLDVRDNPGGLLDQAIQIAGMFMKEQSVVIVRNRDGNEQTLKSRASDYVGHKYPIVVLVNGHSASASEIVAGSLQDHKAATLVGTQSYGKGLVQTLIRLRGDACVAITTQRYYTPKHRDINQHRQPDGERTGGGLKPDVVIEQGPNVKFGEDGSDTQLKKAVEILRKQIVTAN